MEAVAGSFRVRSVGVAADDEEVVDHDDFDSVGDAIDAAASLAADDGMEGADGSLDLLAGSSMEVGQSSYRGCFVAVPAGTDDDRTAENDAVEASYLQRIGSVVAAAAALVAEEADSAPDRALASVNSALPVVVPYFVADTVVVAVADGEDGDFHCCRLHDHPRPLMGHCWGRLCYRLTVVRLMVTVQSPAEERSAAESVLEPSR